jgi:peptidoglycan hydrolase-like protein with peptidoglycan-binding domain
MVFTPATGFSPSTRITVSVPAGRAGVRSAAGNALRSPTTAVYTTGAYSAVRLAEILAQLGYLPMSWQLPNLFQQTESHVNLAKTGLAGQIAAAFDPPGGTFTMEQGYPASLAGMFQPAEGNVVLRGAVMAFQSEHNMSVDGTVTPALWTALFKAAMANQDNANGYTYAVADQVDPETLTIYHDGRVVLQSPANTGIPASPTVNGTFPVYEKFLETWMSGTNPDGSSYHDLVQYVSYFNGGDAVHYFARGAYGFQQSLGCVELPFTQAKAAYPYLTLGSLVTVTG